MEVTATEAKNRLGQMLEHAQREPVTIEKSGRRHSVLMSAEQYDALLAAARPRLRGDAPRTATEFYERYKDWVDEQHRRFEEIGIWNEEFRRW
ncbi:MAG: type II toxin-antitoxin system prevent-host-death family antitoxin [Betaproteobacteria bacterium]|nr:type II toxin-antitoxin system prevent-host-death family antitoxin [Betaproteobacteria bacterium]MCC6248521.1 type II toxin-antitoxin system prevent-host-death family antitoxin [Rubrivivax sp.]MCL4695497.1 type II toxin-antitoxin system prevent-host-death family antitoxin [Burkholderiaceae bacterium]